HETETLSRGLNLTVANLPGTSLPLTVVPGYDVVGTQGGRLYVFAPTGLAGDYANLTPDPITIPNYVHGVAAGDFDGDGKLDVLIANNGYDGSPPMVAVYEQE
ncbi:MAG TPA: VCBS repeat-containing protein, partial [Candidatus Binatus sp.]|nr:VCBS repeat-containing protein [Candidatus Binatus sp.]